MRCRQAVRLQKYHAYLEYHVMQGLVQACLPVGKELCAGRGPAGGCAAHHLLHSAQQGGQAGMLLEHLVHHLREPCRLLGGLHGREGEG